MSVQVGNPAFADDISLLALTPCQLQHMVDIVFRYCQEWVMDINVTKSCVVVFSKKRKPPKVSIVFGNKLIEQTQTAEHLGVIQDSRLSLTERINARIQKGKNAFYSMASQGVHPKGVNPLVSSSLYLKIVIPTVLYACELWNDISQSDVANLNKFQHLIAKKIQGFPIRTRSDIAESMLGLFRITSLIDKQKLVFLHKILSMPNFCITKDIFLRKYVLYLNCRSLVASGFIPDVCNLLVKYNLTCILNQYLADPRSLPSKNT